MAERRKASQKTKLKVAAAVMLLGPLGLLLSALFVKNRNRLLPDTFQGRLDFYRDRIAETEKKLDKLEQRRKGIIGNIAPGYLDKRIVKLQEDMDRFHMERACIYNPAVKMLDNPLEDGKRLAMYYDDIGNVMNLDEKEKETRIQKIRSTYISLSDKGRNKLQEHISKLRI